MSLSRAQATDDMSAAFKAAWDSTGFGTRAKYDNVATTSAPPPGTEPWARLTIKHGLSENATLGGVVGQRRFRRKGVLTVQVFEAPGKGLASDTDLAKIVHTAYEGVTSPGGVIFRKATINEVGPDGDFFQTNVVVDFEYDEIK